MSPHLTDVPDAWWRITCESIHHPVACVSASNFYIWANRAFERLTGYSKTELRSRTWMDITVNDDVIGDLSSVRDVIEGNTESYSTRSRYRHKRGNEVPVDLTCWRFPPDVGEVSCFIVEAIPERATMDQLERIHHACMCEINELKEKINDMARSSNHRNTNVDTNVFNVGNSTNSTKIFAAIVVVIVAVVSAVMYLTYIGGWNEHKGEAKPPATIEAPLQ